MSAQNTTGKRTLKRKEVFFLAVLAVTVLWLQIALPWTSLNWGASMAVQNNDHDFWCKRLQFESLLNPSTVVNKDCVDRTFVSGAIGNHDALFLIKEGVLANFKMKLVRINLETGQVSRSEAPTDLQHVVTDGTTFWVTPGTFEWLDRSFVGQDFLGFIEQDFFPPFAFSGRPVAIPKWNPVAFFCTGPDRMPLIEFVDGHWRSTDLYAFLPSPFAPNLTTPGPFIPRADGKIDVIACTGGSVFFHPNLGFGSEEKMNQFEKVYGRSVLLQGSKGQLLDTTWVNCHLGVNDPLGIWVENGELGIFDTLEERVVYSKGLRLGNVRLQMHRLRAKNNTKPVIVTIPNGYEPDYSRWNWCRLLTGSNGKAFAVTYNRVDSLLQLHRLHEQSFRLVASSSPRRMNSVCLDALWYFILSIAIPTFLLSAVSASFSHWAKQNAPFSIRNTTKERASIGRRSCARAVDLAIYLTPLLLSICLHRNAFSWWCCVNGHIPDFLSGLQTFINYTNMRSLANLKDDSYTLFSDIVEAPLIPGIFGIFLAVSLTQVTIQGYTGKTVGKWLFGISVVGATLKPCGFARSLLRELLLVVDSTGMLFWFPGVACILGTHYSQRIGDLWSDTIVIRDRNRKTHPEDSFVASDISARSIGL